MLTRLDTRFSRSGNSVFFVDEKRIIKGCQSEWEPSFMGRHPRTFINVNSVSPADALAISAMLPQPGPVYYFYEMPRMIPHSLTDGTYALLPAVNKLKILWHEIDLVPAASDWPVHLIARLASTLQTPTSIDVNRLVKHIVFNTKDPRSTIHGDPTLANLVHNELDWYWLDPVKRNYIPGDPHVDLGKMYQSVCGYERVISSQTNIYEALQFDWALMRHVADLCQLNYKLGFAWMIVHYLRLVEYQSPAHQKVFLSFVQAALDELWKL